MIFPNLLLLISGALACPRIRHESRKTNIDEPNYFTPDMSSNGINESPTTGFSIAQEKNITYSVSSGAMSWYAADNYCTVNGGTLALIKDSATQARIEKYLSSAETGKLFWIGLSDQASEGSYVWRDGTTATFLNWHSGEPNDVDGSTDCIHIEGASKGRQWDDIGCYAPNIYALCQTVA